MLVYELRLRIAAQQQTEIVEPSDHTLQLDTVNEENRHRHFLLADVIKEGILQVLLLFAGHSGLLVAAFIVAVVMVKSSTRLLLAAAQPKTPDLSYNKKSMAQFQTPAYPREVHGTPLFFCCRSKAQRFDFAMQGTAFHADEFGCLGDVTTKTLDLRQQVLPLEHFTGIPERQAHQMGR